jgi:Fe-S cluster assembly protein SufD
MSMTSTIEIDQNVHAWAGHFDQLKTAAGPENPDLWALRSAAFAEFERLGFPTTKHEEWKYTSLMGLLSGGYAPAFTASDIGVDHQSGAFYDYVLPAGLDGDIVVLVNGHFDAALSKISSPSVQVGSLKIMHEFEDALVASEYAKVAEYNGRALVALNTAMANGGAFIRIPKSAQIERPIIVLHLGFGDQVAANTRTLIQVEAHASAHIVELWHNWNHGKVWENHVSEIVVGEGASLELVSLQNRVGHAFSLTNFTQVHQSKDSTFRSTVVSTEGNIIRNDLQSLHLGTGCNTYFNGLTVLNGTTHVDHHTLVDHAQPHCYSSELYKSVLDGNSTSVFNGKVMVRPDAQKTNAFQSNKTLLLSDGARVNTKPQLEIFADDVKCSHGATTGRLDETSLFYMRSRGLSAAKAKSLLTYAFGAEVLESISMPDLREWLQADLLERLAGE